MKFNILEKLKEIFLKKSEYKTEKTDFNISEESKLEKLNIGTCIMDNEEKEKFLSINTPKLVELYEKKISEEDKMLMEKQGLKLDTFVEGFKDDLKRDQSFIDLQKEKGYIEGRIIELKEDIKYYSEESQYQSIEELKNELKLYGELNDFLSKEINKVVGSEIEKLEYNAKEYTMKDDLKLEDGSFIKGGTSFFVEGFKKGEFEVHFEAREDNTYIPNDGEGTGYYFSGEEIARYSDLNKTVDLVRGKELINDNMKLDKNNSKDIASLNDMELSFDYKFDNEENVDENGYYIQNNVYIKGYEIDMFDDNKIYGIDPGTEKEVIFEIPKGIKFDEEIFDIKRPTIHYNVNFYKFRTGSRSLMLGSGGIGGSITLNREALN